ncbi:MAG: 2Fe-2S iron-sulfur cluster-binding protein, partial [Planctomycetota bacterium]
MSEGKGFSRRDFLKAFGAIPVAAGVLGGGAKAQAEDKAPAVLGPGPTPITLNVNGRDHALQIPPRTTLLNALRTHLDITGPKEACNTGACGACTVLVDGLPMNACLVLAI